MNTAMLRIKGESKVYMVPEGLPQLLSDISREVLRSSPRNIYQFVAEYLLTVLKVRESVKGAIPTVDLAIEEAAERIGFLNRLNITEDVANKAATVIQAAWRGYLVRKKLRNMTFKDSGEDGIVRSEDGKEREEAAVKIQAFFRGYYTRMKMATEGPGYFLKNAASRDSWSHEWAMKESEARMHPDTECDQIIEHLDDDLRYALARSVEGARLRLATVYRGSYENYELMADSCSAYEVNVLQEAIQARSIHSDSERFIPDINAKGSKGSKGSKSSLSSKTKSVSEEVTAETSKKASMPSLPSELPGEFDVDIGEFPWGGESIMSEESWPIADEEDDNDDDEEAGEEMDQIPSAEDVEAQSKIVKSEVIASKSSKGSLQEDKPERVSGGENEEEEASAQEEE